MTTYTVHRETLRGVTHAAIHASPGLHFETSDAVRKWSARAKAFNLSLMEGPKCPLSQLDHKIGYRQISTTEWEFIHAFDSGIIGALGEMPRSTDTIEVID